MVPQLEAAGVPPSCPLPGQCTCPRAVSGGRLMAHSRSLLQRVISDPGSHLPQESPGGSALPEAAHN